MKFLVDAQLPPALARWLAEQGHEAEHVCDRGLVSASDREIWAEALASGFTIVTKDEDFAVRHSMETHVPTIVWVRLGNTSKQELLRWFEPLLPSIIAALQRSETLIEIT